MSSQARDPDAHEAERARPVGESAVEQRAGELTDLLPSLLDDLSR